MKSTLQHGLSNTRSEATVCMASGHVTHVAPLLLWSVLCMILMTLDIEAQSGSGTRELGERPNESNLLHCLS